MTALTVPTLDDDADVLTAALAYATSGWYILPVRHGSKHPGSVVGDKWHTKSSRDPKMIAAELAGTNHGIALHVGRSGALVFDVDDPDRFPAALADLIDHAQAPHQSTRLDVPGRGHYVFATPAGRRLGNSTGQLGKGWGEIRGTNGIIIAAPSVHEKASHGGRYEWLRTGDVPVLPPVIAALLADATPATDAATDTEVTAFLARHTHADQPHLLDAVLGKLHTAVAGGSSRHEATVTAACWAMREAAAGLYPARLAHDRLADLFTATMADTTPSSSRTAHPEQARAEFKGIQAWAVAQTESVDPVDTRRKVDQRKPPPAAPPVAAAPLPIVDINGNGAAPIGTRPELYVGSAAHAAEWLLASIGTGPLSGMFLRSGDIVYTPREGDDGYIPLTDDDNDIHGSAQIRRATAGMLAAHIQFTYTPFTIERTGPHKGQRKAALFPDIAARRIVDNPDACPHLRWLRGVTHTPLLRADGSVLDQPGHDPTSRLLYLPDPELVIAPVPDTPTDDQVRAAVELLDTMVAGFRFLTAADRANYYGLLLTPLIRELANPPYKMGCIGAPQPGSGKTLLATILRILHGGVFRAEMPEDAAELRKQVTAILDGTTGPVIHLDNVTGVLRSSTLAGLLTSAQWDDRRLGATEMVSRANDRLWVVTGNNLTLGGDLPRRALWVTIDPGVPDPHLRTGFTIPDLPGWVRAHRGELLHALLVLARRWVVAGRPATPTSSDGYSRWKATIAGILATAGVPGAFDGDESIRQGIGADDEEWREFLAAIHGTYGTASWTVKELLTKVNTFAPGFGPSYATIPLDVVPTDLADKITRSHAGVGRSLGRWLRNREGRWAGTYTVRRAGRARENTVSWRIHTLTHDGR